MSAESYFASQPPGAPQEGAVGSYLRAVTKHPFVVALVLLATLGAALGWLAVRSESYESETQLLVTPLPQADQTFLGFGPIRDSGDPTRTVQTAAALIETREAAIRTAQELGPGWDAERVLNAVEVRPQGESNVLDVRARAPSRDEAVRLSNSLATEALAIRDEELRSQVVGPIARAEAQLQAARDTGASTVEIEARLEQLQAVERDGDPTLALAQNAVAADPVGAPASVVIVLALLAGLALGSGAAVLLELATRRIRTDDELLSLYPLPVLSRVPLVTRRMRPGAHRHGPWQMPAAVRESFRTLIAQLRRTGAAADEQAAILLTSPSTGDGKTTSAINLAVALASSGRSVVLLDLDVRKPDVGRSLGLDGGYTAMDLLTMGENGLPELLQTLPYLPSLSVLAITPSAGDSGLLESINEKIPTIVDQARRLADYVVVDTAPLGEVSDALAMTRLMDDVIVVARPGHSNRTNLTIMRDLLGRAGSMPTGYLLIGAAPGASNSYYAHGLAGRSLIANPDDVSQRFPSPSP